MTNEKNTKRPCLLLSGSKFLHIKVLTFLGILFCFLLRDQTIFCDDRKENSDKALIDKYIESKGTKTISFDGLNIKEFWIDHSIASQGDCFKIFLHDNSSASKESIPLKLQLINVNETQNCKVEVIADENNFDYSILNDKMKSISKSSFENSFLQYSIVSSVFSLEDTSDFSFYLQFHSNTLDVLSIKKIILSFPNNPNSSFLSSPGVLIITENDVLNKNEVKITGSGKSFSASGKTFEIRSRKKILLTDNTISSNVTIKNIGEQTTKIYLGYAPFTKDRLNIHNRNNPYKNINNVLTVVSSQKESNTIIVNSYPEWEKGCCLVLNAKDDLSDFPNSSFVGGSITEINKIDDNRAEIILEKKINKTIEPGTKVRVQSKHGNTYLYTNTKTLSPGEEISFSSQIKKDDNLLSYSREAFCKGTYYVVPIILSLSVDSKVENTILITDYSVSY